MSEPPFFGTISVAPVVPVVPVASSKIADFVAIYMTSALARFRELLKSLNLLRQSSIFY